MSHTDCLTAGVSSCLVDSMGDPAGQRGLRRTASSQRSLMSASPMASKAAGLGMDCILGFASKASASSGSGMNSNSSSPQSARNHTLRASGHVPVSSSALSTSDSCSIKDILRCYALFYTEGSEDPPSTVVGSGVHSDKVSHTFVPSARNTVPPSDAGTDSAQCLMLRLNSIPSYLALNRDVPSAPYNANHTPWPRPSGFVKKEQSLMGASCDVKDKVTIKTSTIGANCSIGSKSKINNCILMSDVTVGDNVIIQNSVICSGAVIENNCNLNDVSVGARAKIVQGSKLKGESVAAE